MDYNPKHVPTTISIVTYHYDVIVWGWSRYGWTRWPLKVWRKA